MNFKKILCNDSVCNYARFGILFGLCFPIIAIAFDIFFVKNISLTWSNIKLTHQQNPLHFIIDSAPLFLGLSFGIAGINQNKVIRLNSSLKKNSEEIKSKNVQLKQTIENLKLAQQQLIQSEKMSAVGLLTAGIAHEINNPINFVSANISPLRKDIEDVIQVLDKYNQIDSPITLPIKDFQNKIDLPYTLNELNELVNGIEDGANRTIEIVKGLRNFSRSDEHGIKTANINECIDTTLVLLKHKFQNKIKVIKNYSSFPDLLCYPGQLNQVFMNIISNATDAIVSNGEITINTELLNNEIKIEIIDNGVGMTEEVSKRIFEPFYTTKDVGAGTGLGLSICYGIIEKHKGRITLDSKLNIGTTFSIFLPIQ
jgi:signal transduction histidine kinase